MPLPGRAPAGSAGPDDPLSAREFAARFEASGRVLWTVAAGVLGDPAEAEDVLQEACVMALSKLEQFERGSSFQAWMGRFVRFVALNHARKRQRRATAPTDPEVLGELVAGAGWDDPGGGLDRPPVNPRGELHRDQAAFDDLVTRALFDVARVPRAALLLRAVLGLSYREIASTLEIPEGTAMSHVHRARTLLRERLSGTEEGTPLEMEEPA